MQHMCLQLQAIAVLASDTNKFALTHLDDCWADGAGGVRCGEVVNVQYDTATCSGPATAAGAVHRRPPTAFIAGEDCLGLVSVHSLSAIC